MFKADVWCEKRAIPSPKHSGWFGFIISEGDVMGELDLSFSAQLAKRCGLAERLGKTYTVVWIKEGLLNGWKRAGGARGLRRCLERVFSERDGRRFFKAVWDKADATEQIKARVTERQRAIHDRRTFDADIRDAFSSRGTIRGAAEHFGMG